MNVLITNARGMNNIEKQRERRELIKKNKASIVGKVCETRSSRRDIANRLWFECPQSYRRENHSTRNDDQHGISVTVVESVSGSSA